MYLFHDSTLNTWRLITEKLPEKPEQNLPRLQVGPRWSEYNAAIAALKHNALMVGNPEILKWTEGNNISVSSSGKTTHPVEDKLYFWPGDYDILFGPIKGEFIQKAILTPPEEKKNTMENMTKEQEDELKQDIHAFTLVKALDLLDDCHHYLKANPPSKETMTYNKWESLVEETDYMREYNAAAERVRINKETEYSPVIQESLSDALSIARNKALEDAIETIKAMIAPVASIPVKNELTKLKHKQP